MAADQMSRVLLKISGEGFCKETDRGIDTQEVSAVADEIVSAARIPVQVAVVVGGGNIVRGAEMSHRGVDQATGDYMGMLATVINALALQDTLEKRGLPTRVLTAIPMQSVAEPFIRRRAIRHLEKGRVIILAAGTGNPHFTTDTAAALRATELHAQALLKATKVDGVYTADPNKDASAKKYDALSYMEVLNNHLKVMDSTAISMCMENRIPIIVFNLKKRGNIVRAVRGETIGTRIQ
ncbi:MAG: UMP kinase [Planctomycetes bacterium]|nr:UMP kinase [Planctomycetota bacterium]